MSVDVALDELERRVEEFGRNAFLITSGADRRPHVISVVAVFDGRAFSLPAGRTSSTNVDHQPTATLLWPGVTGPYSLIVDGRARRIAEAIVVDPTRAVLHRLASASDDLPSCVRIESDT